MANMTPEKQANAVAAALAARQEQREAKADAESLLLELADAAYGRGRWKQLAPDKRLAALVKLLEYKTVKARVPGAGAEAPEPDSSATETMTIE